MIGSSMGKDGNTFFSFFTLDENDPQELNRIKLLSVMLLGRLIVFICVIAYLFVMGPRDAITYAVVLVLINLAAYFAAHFRYYNLAMAMITFDGLLVIPLAVVTSSNLDVSVSAGPVWLTLSTLISSLVMPLAYSIITIFGLILAFIIIALNLNPSYYHMLSSVFIYSFTISLLSLFGTVLRNRSERLLELVRLKNSEELTKLNHQLETKVFQRTKDLEKAKLLADIANQTKSAFLANMSHEIRTPLGAVIGFSELLINVDTTPSEKVNFVEAIRRNGIFLSTIINDLLDLSKVEAGKLEIEIQDVTVSEILEDLNSLLKLKAQEKGIQLVIKIGGPIPKSIRTDGLRLRQILLNMVGNAIKFTDRGSVTVTLRLENQRSPPGKLAFLINDTGCGIDAAKVYQLFQPFNQADFSSKRKFGGTGLGLALSKRLANLLNGDVELTESRINEGSTFLVTIDPGPIPEVNLEQCKLGAIESNPKSARPAAQLPKVRLDSVEILLVEDSPDNQFLVGNLLRKAGAKVDFAGNGLEGISKIHLKTYDVVLMDIQMPLMDGREALVQLRSEGYELPIIALTAHALREERQESLALGFDDHITKPVNCNQLIEKVAAYGLKKLGHREHCSPKQEHSTIKKST
jgi:signal transduction histidine kinase/CheY-like chemotaxis protein